MPGHTASIASSHPESIACHEASPWSSFAAEPPAGQLRLDNSTLKFSRSLVESVLSLLKGRLFSTGGDEIVRLLPPFLFCFLQPYLAPPSSSINGCCFAQNEHCYLSDPATAVTINETSGGLDTLLSTFVNRLHSSVRKAGKTPVVWEEMVLGHSLELETDTAVLSWINSVRLSLLLLFFPPTSTFVDTQNHTSSITEQGYRIIHAPYVLPLKLTKRAHFPPSQIRLLLP
jgi:hexosaminidase